MLRLENSKSPAYGNSQTHKKSKGFRIQILMMWNVNNAMPVVLNNVGDMSRKYFESKILMEYHWN